MKQFKRPRTYFFFIALLLAGSITGEEPTSPGHPLDRVAVVGASASSGFGILLRYLDEEELVKTRTIAMVDVVEEVIQEKNTTVNGTGSGLFFWNPIVIGREQIRQAQENEPTLVFALDYLFWYGYGNRDAAGQSIPRGDAGQATRMALLEQGLANLDVLTCPVVVGDFPDMSDAVGYMLSASQIPSPKTLEALNERVQAWAASRPNVLVLHVSKLVESMRSNQAFKAGRHEWPKDTKSRFMQHDNLHPTLDGLIVLVQEANDQLATRSNQIDHAQFDFDLVAVRDRLYEAHRPGGTTSKPYTAVD